MSKHHRRHVLARVVVISAVLGGTIALGAPHAWAGPSIEAREVIGDLNQPVAFTFGPGRKIWYVEKSTGRIRIHNLRTDGDRLFARVPGVNAEGERGTLGIALHPNYPDTPFVYVYVTRRADGRLRNQILRYRSDHGDDVGRHVIFSSLANTSGSNHNGGRILFGPGGLLYAIVGDAGSPRNSQDRSANDRGKILRIRPNGRVPETNPFDNRIWAFGIRNSFGFAFDPETDRLWETDNGPACNDEINLIRRGGNFGWGPNQTCEGASPQNTNQDGPDPIRLPKHFYPDPIGITGIAFCDDCSLGPDSEGAAFFGAVNNGNVRRITLNQDRNDIVGDTVVYTHPADRTISFEVAPSGRIFFSDFSGIYRLVRVT